ncbi:hypothetical protein Taro_032727, partial [Colocasia esculenta]|nr:hypothetical protein [Colocasia esculenta]
MCEVYVVWVCVWHTHCRNVISMICRSNWALRFLCEPRRHIVPSVVVRHLFRNASLVGYPRFFVSQARVFVVLGVGPGTVCTVEGAPARDPRGVRHGPAAVCLQ